ncbi:MAG: 3-deoxy-D-manno-octulosonic acid transferase [Burkholderiaceae bacterium]|nr:3-deoxy-D-manno-octulosonic acid transferase [Burkholderiaceae bacterium]
MARAAYSTLLWLAVPAYVLKLWWRGRAEPLYRFAIEERFGWYRVDRRNDPASAGWVWVHAVSLGETRAASALLTALRAQRPGVRVLLTHGTATGRTAGAALLRPGDRQAWLPFDTPASVERFLSHFQPTVGVLMETEIWPNLLHAAQRRGIPMVLANARLSERSARKAKRFEALFRPVAESVPLVLAQTQEDADRLRAAGAPRVEVSGNLKFDVAPDAAQLALGAAWKRACGRPIVLAASTREGEEAPLLAAWKQQPAPRPLLLIVPRHPQRFDDVAALVEGSGLTCWRRSRWTDAPPAQAEAADVWIGNSIGEMAVYFSCAQVALLGGSFEPLGGQNLIEAAACGCPVLMGPHTFNFAEAAELAQREGAAQRVADIDEGVRIAVEFVSASTGTLTEVTVERSLGAALGPQHALAFAARHRGAAERMAKQIDALIA